MADLDPQEENNDFCSACSGNGQLLCCDGCVRSFHFTCLDPPLDPQDPPSGNWFCNKCEAKRAAHRTHTGGIFSALLGNLEQRNPAAYNLPKDVRSFDAKVKTGENGEYEEVPQQ